MRINVRLSKEKLLALGLYCIFALFMILTIVNKNNFHEDEIYSYRLANGNISDPVFGETYYPSGVAWTDFTTVEGEHRFQYGNVWKNQADDVHPPLYYAILHTICSVFPGCFSKWFAGIINILSALRTLFFVRKQVMLFTGDEKLRGIISLTFIVSAGILSAVSFLRMYTLVMLEVTALTYVLLRQIGEVSGTRRKDYVMLFACMVCGALTHYYFVLYAILISIAYGILLLCKKAYKEMGMFCLTQGLSAAISIGIFPTMLYHVFSGNRGRESFDNLADSVSQGGFDRIDTFFNFFNQELFGGILVYIAASVGACFLIVDIQRHQNDFSNERRKVIEQYFCVLFASILYFVVIAFSAPYLTDRYMFPIYAVVFVTILCLLGEWTKKRFGGYLYVMTILLAVISVNGLQKSEWTYLYRSSAALIDAAREYKETDCVFVYSKDWHMQPAYCEAREYHSITFFREKNLELLNTMDLASRNELIVMVDENDQDILNRIMDICPALNAYRYLGGYGYSNTYYLYPGNVD